MVENRALVIVYNGEELSEYLLSKIVEMLLTSRIVTDINNIRATTFDQVEITKSILSNEVERNDIVKEKEDPVEKAFIFISKYFEKEISNPMKFGIALSEALASSDCPEQLKTACSIVATNNKPTKSLMRKYKIREHIINIIKLIHSVIK